MVDVKEVLNSAESALALGEKEYARRILERYQELRKKFENHGVFDAESWKKFDEKYESLLKELK